MAAGISPGENGGIGLRSAEKLATSAFLASAASTIELQQVILPPSDITSPDTTRDIVEAAWCLKSSSALPPALVQRVQKAWDETIVKSAMETVTAAAFTNIDLARLKAASDLHSSD